MARTQSRSLPTCSPLLRPALPTESPLVRPVSTARPRWSQLLIGAALAAQLACVGSIDSIGNAGNGSGGGPNGDPANPGGAMGPAGSTPGGSPNAMPGTPGSPPSSGGPSAGGPVDPNAAGPLPLRRLDSREYNNTVRDLLGDATRPGDKFPPDLGTEFTFRRAGLVSSLDYSTIEDAAETLALAAEKNVGTLAPCPGGVPAEEQCARDFAKTFGQRAYRRPLDNREIDSLVALYKEVRNAPLSLPYAGGIRVMLQGMLQSPSFIYHWESGPTAPLVEGKLVKLGGYENASQLSYFLWRSMPDATLFDAAAANKLGTQAELEAQAKRMLADPKARATVSEFVEEWLGLYQVTERQKDAKVYPEFKDDLKAAMLEEARAFVSNVVFDGDGRLGTLLTATFSFVNGPLAGIYGLKDVTGTAMKQSPLTATERSGLLTQTAFLAVTGGTDGSHPVKRGKKVFERLLCGELPPPPADVPNPKTAADGGTTRQRFAEHGTNACAAGCHALMDPLGFAFEHYDGIGRYRVMDNGGQVDASDSFEIDGVKKSYGNARELVGHLASSQTVRNCFAQQWVEFALRRHHADADRASLQAIGAAFARDGHNIRDLLVAVAGSRSFRYRTPSEGEVLR